MARGGRGGWVRSIQALYDAGSLGGLEDAELLGLFLGRGEASGAAFEAIVARHAAMVLGVCRAVAGSEADAEDAFQATFLVLACRASSVRNRSALGPWLFGVSRRLATRARAAAARRRAVERRAAGLRPLSRGPIEPDDAVAALIDEVDRLPARYRDPLVLCHLQGMTYEAAARRLGCPLGTLSIRVRRAKERLRRGLERRGVCEASAFAALPGAAAPKALAASTARLASLVAPALVQTGVPASVLSLTQGALTTMRIQQLAAASLVFLSLAAGAWAWCASAAIDGPPSQPAVKAATTPKPARYQLIGRVVDEEGRPAEGAVISVLTHDPALGKLVVKTARSGADGTYTLDLPPGHSQDPSIVPPPGYWDPQSRSPYSAPFALSAESPTARRDFTVKSGASWAFDLTHGDGPAGKAVVETEVKGESGATMHSYAETGPDGRAVLGLPDRKGEAKLTASALSVHARAVHGLLRWDDLFSPETAVKVSRLDGETVRYWATDLDGRSALVESAPGDHLEPRIEGDRLVIHVDLSEKAKETLPEVAGTVVDDFGKPIAGARVEAVYVVGSTSSMGDSDDCAATTDESGRFRLAKLPAISLGKRPNALRLAVTKDAFGAVDTAPIAVEGDAPLFVPPIVLSPGCSIAGVVLGPDGKPVEGAEIEPNGSFSERSRRTWTDADGQFTVTGLPEGEIGLWVRYGDLPGGDPHLCTARQDPQPVEIRLKRR